MDKLHDFFEDRIGAILVALISVITLILAVVVFTVFVGTDTDRVMYIMEAAGGVSIIKGDGQAAAGKNTIIDSGDIIVTNNEGMVRLKAENGKYIYIEPNSTVYVDYSEKSEHGKIIVNVSDGTVVCRLDNKLKEDAIFEVRTPNSIISAKGTVFCVDFSFRKEYMGYENAMLTKVFSVESMLSLQLYNNEGEKSGEVQPLGEGKAAELVSSPSFNGYTSLNQEYSYTELSSYMLRSLIKMSGERKMPIELADLTAAFNAVYNRVEEETEERITVPPATVSTSEYIITTDPPTDTFSELSEETSVISDNTETENAINSDTYSFTEGTAVTEKTVNMQSESITSHDVTSVYSPSTASETFAETKTVTQTQNTTESRTETVAEKPIYRETTSSNVNWWEIVNSDYTQENSET